MITIDHASRTIMTKTITEWKLSIGNTLKVIAQNCGSTEMEFERDVMQIDPETYFPKKEFFVYYLAW